MENENYLPENSQDYNIVPCGPPVWGEVRVGNVLRLRALGRTFTQIGIEMGFSRSAIAGLVFRLGLSQRRKGAISKEERNRRSAAQKRRMRANGHGTPTSGPQMTDLPPSTGDNPTNIMGLKRHHCRWPVDGYGATMLYCGGTKEAGSSYCLRHLELSIRPRV